MRKIVNTKKYGGNYQVNEIFDQVENICGRMKQDAQLNILNQKEYPFDLESEALELFNKLKLQQEFII